ncbi:MAG: acyl-CoA dehydrogenase family protein [Dehalococcoidia bacterium]
MADESALLTLADRLAAGFAIRADQHDREGSVPSENIDELREAGLLRLMLAEPDGGLGADLATAARVLRRLGAGDASTTLIITQHLAVTGAFGWLGSERTRRFLREEVARGGFVALFAGTPEFEGREPTMARRTAGGWLLDGRKGFATGCLVADWATTTAVAIGDDTERESLTCLVPVGQKGFQILDNWDTLGLRATASHDIVMTGLFIPDDDVIARAPEHEFGPRPGGKNLGTGFFSFGVSFFAGLYLGIADAALECLRQTLANRTPVGRNERLIDNPATRVSLVEIELLHRQASAMFEWNIERHRDPARWSGDTLPDLAATKDVVTRTAIEIVERCFQLAGGVAFWRRLPLERYLRDVHGGPLHPLNHSATIALLSSRLGKETPG